MTRHQHRPPALPSLPEPTQRRWQPLRTGLIELFHYDSEEFWFPNGHLLLRGNNGAGKSCGLAAPSTPYRVNCSLHDFQ